MLFRCLLAALLVTSALGYQLPDWYQCDEKTCQLPKCHCASTQPPIPLNVTPQFILITNDDSVDDNVAGFMSQIVNSANNTNNCPIPATWFTLAQGSNCYVIQKLYKRGDELATHTVTHKKLDEKVPQSTMIAEIKGGRDAVVDTCKIPAADVTGYRSTYLVTNPAVRQVVDKLGFLYDSSTEFDMKSGTAADRIWPFTMDYGTAQNSCPPKYQNCNPSEKYPGLWQVPIWDLVYDNQVFTMDPGAHSEGNGAERPTFDVLKAMFDASYNGNKAPLPIYVHDFWFNPQRIADTNKFIQYALSKPNVYFVTMRQLIEWMQNPVPNKQMPLWLKMHCGNTGGNVTQMSLNDVPGVTPGELDLAAASKLSFEDDKGFMPAILGRKMLGTN